MRNPVASPASIIFMTLLFGFAVLVLFSALTTSKELYVLEQNRTPFVWERAFLLFTDSFIALQCAGALLSYSLFLSVPSFSDRRRFLRSLSSVIVSLAVLAAVYVACREGVLPLVKRNMRETRTLGLFSDALFKAAQEKARSGDLVSALAYNRIALLADGRNREKLGFKSTLLSRLTDAQYDEYTARVTGVDPRDEFDVAAALTRARNALAKKDHPAALAAARAVLAAEQGNAEALRIAGIAGENVAAEEKLARKKEAQADETARRLYAAKRDAVAALSAGKAGSARELIRAYYLLADLRRRFPFDVNIKGYLQEAAELLPGVSFFTEDAELTLSFRELAETNIVFWNPTANGGRELVSIEAMVAAGDQVYFKNVEVAGFAPHTDGNRLLYHYLAPLGREIGNSINFTGLHRTDPAQRSEVRVLAGKPAFDPEKGLTLGVPPRDVRAYALSRTDIENRSLSELAGSLPPFRQPSLFSHYARMDELIIREIVLRVSEPFFLIIISVVCLSIGLTQRARYLSSTPKSVYVWVFVIPLVMLAVMDVIRFIYRMSTAFIYDVLGAAFGILIIAALHIAALLLSFLRFGMRLGESLRR